MTMPMLAAVPPDAFTSDEQEAAREASRALSCLSGFGRVQVEAAADGNLRQTFVLPAKAVQMLTDMLAYLAEGRGVSVLPSDAELSTQQAADLLNVSRPYLVRLVEKGAIPFHLAGTHRRIRLHDLLAYRQARERRSNQAMDELVAEAQELELGY